MTPALQDMDVTRIAAGVRSGKLRAVAVVEQVLSEIARLDPRLNCFTAVFADRARKAAMAVDARVARGEYPGLLAGVPFGVKNLFDVKGQVTVAGSKILRGAEPAKDDAVMIRRLEAAGAILIGALNMDEFAYGFSTENEHYGTTRNPHDESRIAGGSSGGSAAAVAARLLPLALGSDTNGSVRVPASLCGVFGLKPTFGRLDRTGMYPFVDSLDHVGIFTRTAADLRHSYDCMHGEAPTPDVDAASLRIALRAAAAGRRPDAPPVEDTMSVIGGALDAGSRARRDRFDFLLEGERAHHRLTDLPRPDRPDRALHCAEPIRGAGAPGSPERSGQVPGRSRPSRPRGPPRRRAPRARRRGRADPDRPQMVEDRGMGERGEGAALRLGHIGM